MKFTGTFHIPTLGAYQKQVEKYLRDNIVEAARHWLRATVVSLIPVWSGASAGTFLKLASEAKFPLNVSPAAGAPNHVSFGRAQSDGEIEVTSLGRASFHYSTTLRALLQNEFARFPRLKRPGPYGLQAAGLAAFQDYLATMKPLPVPQFRIRTKRVG